MQIYDNFIALYEGRLAHPLTDVIITQDDWDAENRRLTASFRLLRDPSKVAGYRHIMQFAEQACKKYQQISLLTLIVGACLDEQTPISPAISCDILLCILQLHIKEQQDIHSFSIMAKAWIDSPAGFAACLRYFVERGLDVHTILTTHLLHDYFDYHLADLGNEENPIFRLYQLLQCYPQTQALVHAAHRVPTTQRGFVEFSLAGIRDASLVQDPVANLNIPLVFTPHKLLLCNLAAIFGVDFYLSALQQWDELHAFVDYYQTLTELLNHPTRLVHDLPFILNKLYEIPKIQPALARLLSAQTLQYIVAQRNGNILALIRFKSDLAEAIQSQDLTHYLSQIHLRVSSNLSLIAGLYELFHALKKSYPASATQVLNVLLDAILQDPYTLEDDSIISKLHRFSQFDTCVKSKVNHFETQLDQCIEQELAKPSPDFITIQDSWWESLSKINLLEQIARFKTTCPQNKYQLCVRVVQKIRAYGLHLLDSETLAQNFRIVPQFSCDVTEYERLLIELLANIDDELLRTQWIQKLDEGVFAHNWRDFVYEGQSLYQMSVAVGNLGLVRWLHKKKINPHSSFETLTTTAARENHWPIVEYFHDNYVLPKVTINLLLNMAVKQGAAHAISMLWAKGKRLPTLAQIYDSIKVAIGQNDGYSLREILHHFKVLLVAAKDVDTKLLSGFKQAMKAKLLNAAGALIEFHTALTEVDKGKNLLKAIKKIIMSALKKNKEEILQSLLPWCAKSLVNEAFLIAASQNQDEAVRCFLNLDLPLEPQTIRHAWNEAKMDERITIVNLLDPICQPHNLLVFSPKKTRSPRLQASKPLSHSTSYDGLKESRFLDRLGFFAGTTTASAITPPPPVLRRNVTVPVKLPSSA